MDFTEFRRRLGAEPQSGDPELRRARESSPEFETAAREAEHLESRIERAVGLPAPEGLVEELQALSQHEARPSGFGAWRRMALAAGLLVAVGAAGITWNMNRGWDSLEEYLVDHYHHDGPAELGNIDGSAAENAQAVLAEFNVRATPELAGIIGLIKYCPSPNGKGIHMVLNTEDGPVTVFYMPRTRVEDKQRLQFDGFDAVLVELQSGSAAIIGTEGQDAMQSYAIVHDAIIPAG